MTPNRGNNQQRGHRDAITGIIMKEPVSQIECYECGRHGTFRHVGTQMVCNGCGHIMGKPVNRDREKRLKAARVATS